MITCNPNHNRKRQANPCYMDWRIVRIYGKPGIMVMELGYGPSAITEVIYFEQCYVWVNILCATFFSLASGFGMWHACLPYLIIQEALSFFGNLHNIKLTWAWRPTTAITTGNGKRQARPCYLDWRIAHKWEARNEIAHMEVLTSCSRHDRSFCTLVLSSFLHMWAWISTQSLVCTDRAEG